MRHIKKLVILFSILVFITLCSILFYFRGNLFFNKIDDKLFKESPEKVTTDGIPKILYKISPVPTKITPELEQLFNKIKIQNPDYRLEYFDDIKCVEFLKEHFEPEVLEAFHSLVPPAYKCDLMRYCIMYINGGIYGDLFQDYYLPLDKIINHKNDKLVLVQDRYSLRDSINAIQISFMATYPKNPIYKECIDKIVKNVKTKFYGYTDLEPTGPMLFSKIFYKNYLNTDYTMKLKPYNKKLINYKTNEDIIKLKIEGYNKVITGDLKYGKLWRNRKIYKL